MSKFDLHYTDDDAVRESILGTTSYYSPGFHINQINDFRLGDHLNLRLMPGITLISRDMAYVWSEDYTSTHWKYDTKRTVESVYGEIPMEFKFRAMRYTDFRPYLIAGGSFGFGKAVFWMISQISTIFVSTKPKNDEKTYFASSADVRPCGSGR